MFNLTYWYRRRAGGREMIRLAGPIVISSASLALMNFADRLYLTWYDQSSMSAAFQAGCLLWTLLNFPVGIACFTNTFVSQYNGARQYKRIGTVVWQGVFFGLLAGLIFVALTPLVAPFFRMIAGDSQLIKLEEQYWFYLSIGAGVNIAHEPLTAYFSGRRDTKTVMWVGVSAIIVNAVLDPILIFGINGHMRWGVVGAAIASTIALFFKFFVYLALALHRDKTWQCGLRDRIRLDIAEMTRLVKLGAMSALQFTFDAGVFELFILLMAWFGEDASGAAAIAFNLDFLAFMPIVGIGVATSTSVGNYVGAKRFRLAQRSVFTALTLTVACLGFFAVAYILAPNFFLDFYALNDPEKFMSIRPLAVNALRFISLYLVADGVNVVMASALRGAGDARFIMIGTLSIALPMLGALFLGVFRFGYGLSFCWTMLFAYVMLLASTFLVRFCIGSWRSQRLVQEERD
ncbi:MAG: MATE family efflux transporter [Planctomycetia bacterium]|nr:MATE family efflux transporter [Planctomycetia bacterium]